MKAFVTGGAGFIGSHMVDLLLSKNFEVTVLDTMSTGKESNLAHCAQKIKLINNDLNSPEAYRDELRSSDYVFHFAARPSVPLSVEDPLGTNKANVEGTLVLLNECRSAPLRKLVFSSSSSVYGDTPRLPKAETMQPSPQSPYAVSKLVGELYCKVFSRVYNLPTVSLRYFNVFGPRQRPDSAYAAVIPKFVSSLRSGQRPAIFGDGSASRDFTYVSDVTAANLLAAESKVRDGTVMNIAAGKRTTVVELVTKLNKLLGTSLKPKFEKERAGDIKHSLASIALAKKLLNYKPAVSFGDGLKKTLDWRGG